MREQILRVKLAANIAIRGRGDDEWAGPFETGQRTILVHLAPLCKYQGRSAALGHG